MPKKLFGTGMTRTNPHNPQPDNIGGDMFTNSPSVAVTEAPAPANPPNLNTLGLFAHQAKQGSDYRNIYGNGEPADKQQPSKAVANAVQETLHNIQPQDDLEAMLVTQAITLHNATMQCLVRAAKPDASFHGRQSDLNLGNKLSRTFIMQMEALNRHRGNGAIEQRITVQYVNVGDGGKAIVGGNLTPGTEGGGQKKKE